MRKTKEELEQIKKEYGVNELWSYSRLSTYKTSKWEYFLKYIKQEKPLSEVKSVYGIMGGAAHDIIEQFYEGKIKKEDMLAAYMDEWTMNVDMYDLKFSREDAERNKNMADKYYQNMCHYFKHFQPISYKKIYNEYFIITKITDDIIIQGYVDNFYGDDKNNCIITDWKSSSKYSKKDMIDKAAQLILYSEGLRQLGIPEDKIACRWGFLKYADISIKQINGKVATISAERRQIGEKCISKAKVWLKKLCPNKDADALADKMLRTNDIKCLPKEVRDKFSIDDCYVYIDKPIEQFQILKEEIIDIVNDIHWRTDEWKKTGDNNLWWDDDETCKRESFYFSNLCDYSINQLLPYKNYLERLQNEKENIFSNTSKKSLDDMSNDELLELLGLI